MTFPIDKVYCIQWFLNYNIIGGFGMDKSDFERGREDGYLRGFEDGRESGLSEGYEEGHEVGHEKGCKEVIKATQEVDAMIDEMD